MRAAKFGRSTVTRLMTINSVPRCPIDGARERVCPGTYQPEQRPSLLDRSAWLPDSFMTQLNRRRTFGMPPNRTQATRIKCGRYTDRDQQWPERPANDVCGAARPQSWGVV